MHGKKSVKEKIKGKKKGKHGEGIGGNRLEKLKSGFQPGRASTRNA